MPIISACTCRFRKPGEFSDATLVPETECGYHAAKGRNEANDEARRMATLLHAELGTGGNGCETPYSIAERAVSAYKRLELDASRWRDAVRLGIVSDTALAFAQSGEKKAAMRNDTLGSK